MSTSVVGDRARRPLLSTAALAGVVLLSACGQSDGSEQASSESTTTTTEAAQNCAEPPAPDVTTADGWLGYLAANPDSTSFYFDAGEGTPIQHDADVDRPLASAVKVVHLAAYARAVAAGDLDPEEQVPVYAWETWYLPGTDGGAHDAALARLGADASSTVRLDDIVSAMIINSDNAAPDYLRSRLGDQALVDAAAAGGWQDFEPPTLLGSMIAGVVPAAVTGDPWETARRYASDEVFRATIREQVTAALPQADPERLDDVAGSGSAVELTAIHRSIADGSFGDGDDVARRHLEWQPSQLPGVEGVGNKGGSLPGVITDALTLRYEDGFVASAVLLVDDMPDDSYLAALPTFAWQNLMVEATTNPARADQLRCLE